AGRHNKENRSSPMPSAAVRPSTDRPSKLWRARCETPAFGFESTRSRGDALPFVLDAREGGVGLGLPPAVVTFGALPWGVECMGADSARGGYGSGLGRLVSGA